MSDPIESDLCGCEYMKSLVQQGKVRYTSGICDCSPFERHYELLDDKWVAIDKCPGCGKPIPNVPFVPIVGLFDILGARDTIPRITSADCALQIDYSQYPVCVIDSSYRCKSSLRPSSKGKCPLSDPSPIA